MWENALQVKSPRGITVERSHDWKGWAGVGIGLLLIAIGVIGIRFCPNEFGLRFSEAIFIAGVLTAAVDPFVKRRLLKEASFERFFASHRSYRKNAVIDVTIVPLTGGNEVELIVTLRADIVAVARTAYKQHISFEEAECGTILEATVTSQSHPEESYTKHSPPLTPVADELMVSYWTGRAFELKKDEFLNSFIRFRMQKPIRDFWTLNFGIPTIYPTVHINADPSLIVTASKADQINGNEHIYKKVFVSGDHLQIRWKPKGPFKSV
jgi:hypothetical protein